MGLMDILQQYEGARAARIPSSAHQDFDEVAGEAPQEVVGQGVGDAFRAEETPPFGEMVGQLFGSSNPVQRAGLLNQLVRSVAPGVLASLGGGILGRLGSPSTVAEPRVTPEEAARLTPDQVNEIATHAEKHDPSILDKVGGFYAQHPQLVKTLGSAALAITLAGISNRMRGR